jgi:hypothetical protein
MQERRFRPGDVLDDYCPRDRRITDHAIVAMIEDEIRRTRCVSCDTEHEYKEGKVPAPRRKTQPPALFTQVLEGLQGPTARPHSPPPTPPVAVTDPSTAALPLVASPGAPSTHAPPAADGTPIATTSEPPIDDREEGPVRRPLIRAQFPKIEGQAPIPRAMPEFTIQALANRGRNGGAGAQRNGGGGHGKGRHRRRAAGPMDTHVGPMRFGRDSSGPGGHGEGRPHGQGQGGRRRRGGKKNR